jgi:hypothetical protein
VIGLVRVCKPCWELKYCPYGPLVEQSPLLPAELKGTLDWLEYLKNAVHSGKIGSVRKIDNKERAKLRKVLEDRDQLVLRAVNNVRFELFGERAGEDDPGSLFSEPLPPIEQYRMPFEAHVVETTSSASYVMFIATHKDRVDRAIEDEKSRLEAAIEIR